MLSLNSIRTGVRLARAMPHAPTEVSLRESLIEAGFVIIEMGGREFLEVNASLAAVGGEAAEVRGPTAVAATPPAPARAPAPAPAPAPAHTRMRATPELPAARASHAPTLASFAARVRALLADAAAKGTEALQYGTIGSLIPAQEARRARGRCSSSSMPPAFLLASSAPATLSTSTARIPASWRRLPLPRPLPAPPRPPRSALRRPLRCRRRRARPPPLPNSRVSLLAFAECLKRWRAEDSRPSSAAESAPRFRRPSAPPASRPSATRCPLRGSIPSSSVRATSSTSRIRTARSRPRRRWALRRPRRPPRAQRLAEDHRGLDGPRRAPRRRGLRNAHVRGRHRRLRAEPRVKMPPRRA
jgi:hypothetical protein